MDESGSVVIGAEAGEGNALSFAPVACEVLRGGAADEARPCGLDPCPSQSYLI